MSDKTDEEVGGAVHHPSHYNKGGIEVIDIIEKWGLGFCLGSALKYVFRAPHKGNPLQDYKKAHFYIQRVLDRTHAEDFTANDCLQITPERVIDLWDFASTSHEGHLKIQFLHVIWNSIMSYLYDNKGIKHNLTKARTVIEELIKNEEEKQNEVS